MDNSHVALVAVKLDADGFKKYRCDRPIPLGVNFASLTKVLKCAKDDDIVTIKADDDGDVLNLTYEARCTWLLACLAVVSCMKGTSNRRRQNRGVCCQVDGNRCRQS